MSDRLATTLGLHPLPDPAKDKLQRAKGNQMSDLITGAEPEPITTIYEEARATLTDQQAAAGLDIHVEGQARWDDMLAHPLAVSEAVETRGLVRYYDNNNFYREPVVTDELSPTGDLAAELTAAASLTDAPLQAVLPGPYTLAELATDDQYGDEDAFLAAVAEFLAGEAAAAPAVETLFLLAPSLATAPPTDGERVRTALTTITEAVTADVAVVPYWGTVDDQTYTQLLDAEIDALGYDLVTAPEAATELAAEYGTPDDVVLGVVDGQNTLVESPSTVGDRIDAFTNRAPTPLSRVYVTPNTGLFHLPTNRFEEKLETLGAVTTEVPA
jgi:Methionine synthase II (cobalamin-independent)